MAGRGLEPPEVVPTDTTDEDYKKFQETIDKMEKEQMEQHKYEGELEWDKYFMKIACLAALRSKDPSTAVGACIADTKHEVVGIGYNAMPYIKKEDWEASKESKERKEDLSLEYLYVVHAAVNAITNRTRDSLEGCTIYLTLHPGMDCAHAIIRSGIRTVKYCMLSKNEPDEMLKVKKLFQEIKDMSLYPMNSSELDEYKFVKKLKKRLSECSKKDSETAYEDPISWETFFMEIAKVSITRPGRDTQSNQVQGACIVSQDKKVISVGSNNFHDDIKVLPEKAYEYVTHAEYQAILGGPSVKGCTLYVTKYPCNKCAQVIVQSGIAKVVYDEEGTVDEYPSSRDILKKCLKSENIKKYNSDTNKGKLITILLYEVISKSPEWNRYFMKIACLAALRSKDPSTPVGACIVEKENHRVVGIGYNSMPYMKKGDNDRHFPWKGHLQGTSSDTISDDTQVTSDSTNTPDATQSPSDSINTLAATQGGKLYASKQTQTEIDVKTKDAFVVHAAVNAITNRTKRSLHDCVLYVTLHPDKDCAHAIATAGIKEVYYCKYRRTNKLHEGIKEGKRILKKSKITTIKMNQEDLENEETKKEENPAKKLAKRIAEARKSGPASEAYKDYMSWDSFFMNIAKESKNRPGSDKSLTSHGAGTCIVSPEKQVISVGTSIKPLTMADTEDTNKSPNFTHAEACAILGGPPVRGCILYVTKYPCNNCAQVIVQAGITEVIYEQGCGEDIDGGKEILTACLGAENIKHFKNRKQKGYFIVSEKKV